MENSAIAAIIAIVVVVAVVVLFLAGQRQPVTSTTLPTTTAVQQTTAPATSVNTTVTTTIPIPLPPLEARLLGSSVMLYGVPNQSEFMRVQNASLQESGYMLYEDTYTLPYNSLLFSTQVLNSSTVVVVAPQYAQLTSPLTVDGGIFAYNTSATANASYSVKLQNMLNNTFGFRNLTELSGASASVGPSARLWEGYAYGLRVYLLLWHSGSDVFVLDTYGNPEMNGSYINGIGAQWGNAAASTP